MAVEIITDGSYARKTVGIGYVRMCPEKNNGNLGFVADSQGTKMPEISKYGSQGAEAFAVIAALDALHETGYEGDVIIYCDCSTITDYINGKPKKFADDIMHIAKDLDAHIELYTSVRALHPKSAKHLPRYLSAIAHNASAIESGANKREKTTPEYTGPYSSDFCTRTSRDAFYRGAKGRSAPRRGVNIPRLTA
jgi:ribonuclease HI